MKVKFKAENGLCPYFEYGDLKFYIQDHRQGSGYKYTCYVQHKKSELLTFTDDDAALAYVRGIKGTHREYQSEDKTMYISINSIYIICKNTVEVRPSPRPLTWEFDNYSDCLKVAKEKVIEYINQNEPQQVCLFA